MRAVCFVDRRRSTSTINSHPAGAGHSDALVVVAVAPVWKLRSTATLLNTAHRLVQRILVRDPRGGESDRLRFDVCPALAVDDEDLIPPSRINL